MGHDTFLFAEAVFLGESVYLTWGNWLSNEIFNGTFHQPCDGSITLS